ncbi:MAG: putative zinc-binding metallopeptidase [Gemmatimonadales bacterium]|nr:putative zinc-binding metallopeptidase [Gemmatimonadales bacterium]
MSARSRRAAIPSADPRCRCGYPLDPFWPFCPDCGRAQTWRDTPAEAGDQCPSCGWAISPKFLRCPWCATMVYDEKLSAKKPLKAPKGFRMDAKCDWGCGGGVQYPMPFCPWCGRPQSWNEDDRFEGECSHCTRGVDDWMDHCPWCGQDATGRDLIPKALIQVRQLLRVAGVADWGYRILLRPGVSGVDPRYPKVVEIEKRYVTGVRRRDEIPWSMLIGLISHELGHSFLYHHWHWTSTRAFRRTFGEASKAYRINDDAWVDFQRRRVAITPVDHVSGYAARHPQEDFAETFRYYVTRRGRLRELFAELGQRRKGAAVYEKFILLKDYIQSLREWR